MCIALRWRSLRQAALVQSHCNSEVLTQIWRVHDFDQALLSLALAQRQADSAGMRQHMAAHRFFGICHKYCSAGGVADHMVGDHHRHVELLRQLHRRRKGFNMPLAAQGWYILRMWGAHSH